MLLIIATTMILFYGKVLLIPLAFGMLFAFLLNPIHDRLVNWGVHKYIAAILSTLIIFLFVLILLGTLGWQIRELAEQSSQIKKELIEMQKQIQQLIKNWFGINFSNQEEYAKNAVDGMKTNVLTFLGGAVGIISQFLISLVYTILLLAERTRIYKFFHRIFQHEEKADSTVEDVSQVTRKYLIGKMMMIGFLAVVYSIGFYFIGIKYSILIAVLSAFLTFIPFVGNLVGGAIAVLITLATGGSNTEIMLIVIVMSVGQIVESYILQPWIVGDNVDLNPLTSIFMVIAFSLVWGAAGSVLAMPLSGMLKVLFDHLKPYQPLGFLMGTGKKEESS